MLPVLSSQLKPGALGRHPLSPHQAETSIKLLLKQQKPFRPHQHDSVGWARPCKAKGLQFSSLQGTCLGFRFGPQVEGTVLEATNGCFSPTSVFLSSSFSLPHSLSKNKKIIK